MSIKSTPTWYSDITKPKFPALSEDVETDVCIIGGGHTGILSAYLLTKAGKRVVLLEKDEIGSGATGRTTAILTQVIDTDIHDLILMLGEDRAKAVLDSHLAAINLIEQISTEEHIDCEMKRGPNVVYASDDAEVHDLEKEFEAAKKIQLDVEFTHSPQVGFPARTALSFPSQGKFHPLKFLIGVAKAAEGRGAKIFEHTEALEITKDSRFAVRTKDGTVTASHVVSATHSPFKEPAGLFLKKGMYVTYMYELEIPSGRITEGTYEDLKNPYHYFRVDKGNSSDRIIVGGEDHRSDIPVSEDKNWQALEEYMEATFAESKKVRRWRGPILEPIDGRAFIGPYGAEGILYAFGFSGTGMTYGAIAAEIVTDAVVGKRNQWQKLYEVSRIPGGTSLLIKGRDFAQELFNGAIGNSVHYRKEK